MEWQGQLLDVLDVVDEDAYQMNNESDDKSNSYNEKNLLNESNSSNESYNKRIPILPQVGGWGLQPLIVTIGIGDFLLLLLCVCFLVHE